MSVKSLFVIEGFESIDFEILVGLLKLEQAITTASGVIAKAIFFSSKFILGSVE